MQHPNLQESTLASEPRPSRRRARAAFALLVTLTLAVPTLAAPASCGYAPLSIEPIAPSRADRYVGKARSFTVQFDNEDTATPVTTFPESNLKILRLDGTTVCEVDDGIWVRDALYLSGDERLLIAKRFSGSNDVLAFYDTRSCALKAQVDVSGRAWRIEADGVRLGEHCTDRALTSCQTTTLRRWSRACLPRRAARR